MKCLEIFDPVTLPRISDSAIQLKRNTYLLGNDDKEVIKICVVSV